MELEAVQTACDEVTAGPAFDTFKATLVPFQRKLVTADRKREKEGAGAAEKRLRALRRKLPQLSKMMKTTALEERDVVKGLYDDLVKEIHVCERDLYLPDQRGVRWSVRTRYDDGIWLGAESISLDRMESSLKAVAHMGQLVLELENLHIQVGRPVEKCPHITPPPIRAPRPLALDLCGTLVCCSCKSST